MYRKLSAAILVVSLVLIFVPFEARSAMNVQSFETRVQAILEWAKENGRGVSVHFDGQVLHGVVREILEDAVVMSNQERGEIVVRRAAITAVAGR